MNDHLHFGEAGFDLVRRSEGCRLTAYRDIVGVLTVGYGHTGSDVVEGMTITQDQADQMLRYDCQFSEMAVKRLVAVELNQEQYDALVDFVFNCGVGAFQKSTLLRRLNRGDYDGAAEEFPKWNQAGGVVVQGLVKRRRAEQQLFTNHLNHD